MPNNLGRSRLSQSRHTSRRRLMSRHSAPATLPTAAPARIAIVSTFAATMGQRPVFPSELLKFKGRGARAVEDRGGEDIVVGENRQPVAHVFVRREHDAPVLVRAETSRKKRFASVRSSGRKPTSSSYQEIG